MTGGDEDPAAWLRAQIGARKAAAEALAVSLGASWLVRLNDDDGFDFTIQSDDIDLEPAADTWRRDAAAHIAASDPRDTIARCEAELAILHEHGPELVEYRDGDGIERSSLECVTCEPPGTPDDWPCRTVRLLASAYKHHPGYLPAWAPAERAAL